MIILKKKVYFSCSLLYQEKHLEAILFFIGNFKKVCYNNFGDDMKKIFLLAVICLLCVTGCFDKKEKEYNKELEVDPNLGDTLKLDTKDAKAVCRVNLDYLDTQQHIESGIFAIYTDEDGYVTRVTSEQKAAFTSMEVLQDFQEQLTQNYETFKGYGGYQYSITVEDNVLNIQTDIDYTKYDVKKLMEDTNDSLKTYLTEDYRFSLKNMISMYKQIGATCEEY